MARPKKDIDARQVEKLAAIGCTNSEIADLFAVNEGTIRKGYSENLTKGRSALNQRLRRKQLSVAMGGNVAMLIWLGKQMLNQSDKADVTEHGETTQHVFTHAGAIARIAPRSMGNRQPSGAGESGDDGAALGEDAHGG